MLASCSRVERPRSYTREMQRRTTVQLMIALGGMGVGLACVSAEHRKVVDLQEQLARCVEIYSETSRECDEIRGALRVEQQRYEEQAKKAWSCDPAQDRCPTPR